MTYHNQQLGAIFTALIAAGEGLWNVYQSGEESGRLANASAQELADAKTAKYLSSSAPGNSEEALDKASKIQLYGSLAAVGLVIIIGMFALRK